MRLFGQHLVRATRWARHTTPTFISARHLARTHPTYESSSKVSDHSAESYLKEVDSSPPADPSTYQVDDSSDAVQRPHKPPSGKYSQAGVGSDEYRTVDKQTPYDPPSQGEAGKKLRYGGKGQEKGGETEAASARGRKPERKQ